jgi:hypothetical protein
MKSKKPIKIEKPKTRTITGYNVYGKKVVKHLDKGEVFSDERCPVCNTVMLEDYYDAPYVNYRCIICGDISKPGKYNTKRAIKNLSADLASFKIEVKYLTVLIKTLKEENNVRKLNGKIFPKLEGLKK